MNLMRVSMIRFFFVTNEPTDKAILGVGFTFDNCGVYATMKVFESGCH